MEKHTDNSNAAQSNDAMKDNHGGKVCYTRRVDGRHVHLFKIARWTDEHLFFVDDMLPPMPRILVDKNGVVEADFAIVFDNMKAEPYGIQEAEYHRNYVHIKSSIDEVRRLRKAHRSSMFDAISALVAMKLFKALMDDEADAEEEGVTKDYVASSNSLEGLKPSIQKGIEAALRENADKPTPQGILINAQATRMSTNEEERKPELIALFVEAIEKALADESVTKGIRYITEMKIETGISFVLRPQSDSE